MHSCCFLFSWATISALTSALLSSSPCSMFLMCFWNMCSLLSKQISEWKWMIKWWINLVVVVILTGWRWQATRQQGPALRTPCECKAWIWYARCWPDTTSCCHQARCSCSQSTERLPVHRRLPTGAPPTSPTDTGKVQAKAYNYMIIIITMRHLYSAIMPLGGYRGAGGTCRQKS